MVGLKLSYVGQLLALYTVIQLTSATADLQHPDGGALHPRPLNSDLLQDKSWVFPDAVLGADARRIGKHLVARSAQSGSQQAAISAHAWDSCAADGQRACDKDNINVYLHCKNTEYIPIHCPKNMQCLAVSGTAHCLELEKQEPLKAKQRDVPEELAGVDDNNLAWAASYLVEHATESNKGPAKQGKGHRRDRAGYGTGPIAITVNPGGDPYGPYQGGGPPIYGSALPPPPIYGPIYVPPPNYGPPHVTPPNYGPPHITPPNYGPPYVAPPNYVAATITAPPPVPLSQPLPSLRPSATSTTTVCVDSNGVIIPCGGGPPPGPSISIAIPLPTYTWNGVLPTSTTTIPYKPVVTTTPYIPVIPPTPYKPVIAPTPYKPVIAPTPYIPVITPTPYIPVIIPTYSSGYNDGYNGGYDGGDNSAYNAVYNGGYSDGYNGGYNGYNGGSQPLPTYTTLIQPYNGGNPPYYGGNPPYYGGNPPYYGGSPPYYEGNPPLPYTDVLPTSTTTIEYDYYDEQSYPATPLPIVNNIAGTDETAIII